MDVILFQPALSQFSREALDSLFPAELVSPTLDELDYDSVSTCLSVFKVASFHTIRSDAHNRAAFDLLTDPSQLINIFREQFLAVN